MPSCATPDGVGSGTPLSAPAGGIDFAGLSRRSWEHAGTADRREGGPAKLGNTTCFMFPATATEPTTHWWAELPGC